MADSNQRLRDLEEKRIPQLLWAYALPAVIGTMVNALYNVVDRIFIGQWVGGLAITGLGIDFPLMLVLQAFGMIVGAGAAARTSIYIGSKDVSSAEKVLTNALFLTFIIQFCMLIPAFIYKEELVRLFGASDETMPYAVDYLKIIIPGNIFATLTFSFNNIMRASGYPKKAMWTMLIGAGLNVLLDPLFIKVFGWGIEGAAVATVISMMVTAIVVMAHYFRKDSVVRFRREAFVVSPRIMGLILILGVPPFCVQIIGSLVSALVNNSFVIYSADRLTADMNIGSYTIMNSLAMLIVMFVLGISQGMQPIVGFNYGARKFGRTLECYRMAVGINLSATTAGCLVAMFMPGLLVRCFTADAEIIAIAVKEIRWGMFGFFAVGFQITSGQFMQCIGKAKMAIAISTTRRLVFLIPLLLIMPGIVGLKGVWMAGAIADLLAAGFTMFIIVWQVRKLREAELQTAE